MRSSLGNRPSSIDLSFEEGFSFLGNETNEPAERPKPTESHWLFDKDDSLDVFLPNSPSRNQMKRPLALNTPSYAQQTFTSSIASLGKQDRDRTPVALEKSSTYVSPIRRTPPRPTITSHNAHTSNIYTSPLTKVWLIIVNTNENFICVLTVNLIETKALAGELSFRSNITYERYGRNN